VYKGHSIGFWSQMNRDPHSSFIGFDSFEGLPENWTKKVPKGAFYAAGAAPISTTKGSASSRDGSRTPCQAL
jgi:O-methyltransferase